MSDVYYGVICYRNKVQQLDRETYLGPSCNPIPRAPSFIRVPIPPSASRCQSELPCTHCVLVANGDGRTNFAGSRDAASKPNQVGMTKQAIGDLDFESIGAITAAPLCYERYIPRSVIRGASGRHIKAGGIQSKSKGDRIRNVFAHDTARCISSNRYNPSDCKLASYENPPNHAIKANPGAQAEC